MHRKPYDRTMKPDNRTIVADYYQAHWTNVVAYVEGRIRDRAEAEDIVQELFLKLLCPDRLLSEITLPALVYTMARNAATDWWRVRNLRRQTALTDTLTSPYNPANYVAYGETLTAYERGLTHLKATDRKILRLNIEQKKPVSEISLLTGLAYKQAEYRLGVARKQIRQYMRKAVGM